MVEKLRSLMNQYGLSTPPYASMKDNPKIRKVISFVKSYCPIKCVILLSALFIDVKILFKKFTLFYDKIHQTKLKLCSNNSKNNKMTNKNQICKFFCNFIPKWCKAICLLNRLSKIWWIQSWTNFMETLLCSKIHILKN